MDVPVERVLLQAAIAMLIESTFQDIKPDDKEYILGLVDRLRECIEEE